MTKKDLEDIKQLLITQQAYACPHINEITQIPQLIAELRRTNERGDKTYSRLFEDNGQSIVSEVRANRNDIEDLKHMQQQTFDLVKSFRPNGGKKVFGKISPEIYSKIWMYLIRIAIIAFGGKEMWSFFDKMPK